MILITGGLGYLGGRFSRYLSQTGEPVRIATSRGDVKLPEVLSECELIELDLMNPISLANALSDVKTVIHLASMNAQECLSNPEKAVTVNGVGTLNLLNSAIEAKVNKFIYFSSIHVYGAPLNGFLNESIVPEPAHPYSISRHLAENFVLATKKQNSMNSIVLRLSNAVGKPLTRDANCWMLVAHDLCRQAIENRCLILKGDGKDVRNFIAIGELLQIINQLVQYQTVFPYRLVNVGGGNTYSIRSIAEMIVASCNKLFGFKPEIIHNKTITAKSEKAHLDYSCENLYSICQIDPVSIQEEIDELLLFCQKEFAK